MKINRDDDGETVKTILQSLVEDEAEMNIPSSSKVLSQNLSSIDVSPNSQLDESNRDNKMQAQKMSEKINSSRKESIHIIMEENDRFYKEKFSKIASKKQSSKVSKSKNSLIAFDFSRSLGIRNSAQQSHYDVTNGNSDEDCPQKISANDVISDDKFSLVNSKESHDAVVPKYAPSFSPTELISSDDVITDHDLSYGSLNELKSETILSIDSPTEYVRSDLTLERLESDGSDHFPDKDLSIETDRTNEIIDRYGADQHRYSEVSLMKRDLQNYLNSSKEKLPCHQQNNDWRQGRKRRNLKTNKNKINPSHLLNTSSSIQVKLFLRHLQPNDLF